MKRFLSIALCILALLSIRINMVQASNQEIEKYNQLESEYCKAFMIPDEEAVCQPDTLFSILSDTAEETSTNIIRSFFTAGETKGSYEVKKYVLVKKEGSPYLSSYPLKSGRMLSAADTASKDTLCFLSTRGGDKQNQLGRIDSALLGTEVSLYPLGLLFDYVKPNGLYFVELTGDMKMEDFLLILHDKILEVSGVDVKMDSLRGEEDITHLPSQDTGVLYILLAFAALLFILLTFYYLFQKKRKIAVMKLMGVKPFSIWKNFFMEPLLTFFLFGLLSILFLQYRQGKWDYACRMTKDVWYFYPILILFFWLAYSFSTIHLDFTAALKGEKNVRGVLLLNGLVKIIGLFFILYTGASFYAASQEMLLDIQKYKKWDIAKDYGVFYPFYIGDEHTRQEEYERDVVIGSSLYSLLNQKGALFINAGDFEDEFLRLNKEQYEHSYEQSLMVNPNYLQAYPVYDEKGQNIVISEEEKDIVLLVPEGEKANQKAIVDYYQESQASWKQVDEEMYGLRDRKKEGQKVKIIWMKAGQRIFTFNSAVSMDIEGILDPVIFVVTENNSYISQRIGVHGKGNADPLKIRLQGSSKETYDSIKQELSDLGLADNLKALVSINEQAEESLAILRANLRLSIQILLLLLALMVYLVYQSAYLLFEKNKKDYVIKACFGQPWRKIYGRVFDQEMGILIVVSLVYAWYVREGGITYILLAAVFLMLLQFLVIYWCMRKQLKNKRSDVLKGI